MKKPSFRVNEVVKVATYGLGIVRFVEAIQIANSWRYTYTVRMRNTDLVITCPDGRFMSKTKHGVLPESE